MARAFSGPESEQVVRPCTGVVDALASLMSGEPYEVFRLDRCPVERGSFRCIPADLPYETEDLAPHWVADAVGDGDLMDSDGSVIGGISYGYSNEDGGRFWLLRRVAVRAPEWFCEYRYVP